MMNEEKTDLFVQVNTPKAPASMTDPQKKHLAAISDPGRVKAGECFVE